MSITKGSIVDVRIGSGAYSRGKVVSYFGSYDGLRATVQFVGRTKDFKVKDLREVPEDEIPKVGDKVRLKDYEDGKVLGTVYKVDHESMFYPYRVEHPDGSKSVYSHRLEKVSEPVEEKDLLAEIRSLIAAREQELVHLRETERILVG